VKVQPYLNFDGRCEEAVEFYRDVLDAQVEMLMRFKDAPATGDHKDQPESSEACMVPPGAEDKVMHVSLRIGESVVMASDCSCTGQASFQGVSLALTAADVAEAERLFAALAEGGQVQMPMAETFFSPRFGVVADRFGVSWMIVVGA
jgi:PhnB protein